jgi:4-hydroxybenzoate polyprenyltransferase
VDPAAAPSVTAPAAHPTAVPDPPVVHAFLMCTSACFVATYYLPYLIGLTAAHALHPPALLGGLVFFAALSTAVEALNRISDRQEDEVNRPGRTHLCHLVGYDRLAGAARVALVAAVASALWMGLRAGTPLAWLFLFLSLGVGVGYSFMPGGTKPLKRSRLLSPSLNAMPTVGPVLVGYTTAPTWAGDRTPELVAVALLLYLAILGIGGAKDVTDLRGDATIGYRSAYLDHLGHDRLLHPAYMGGFTAVTVVLVAVGPLSAWSRAPIPAVIGAYWWVLVLSRRGVASPGRDAMRARLVSSHLQTAVVAVIGLAAYPVGGLALGTAAVLAYWVAARRWLYWARYEMQAGLV